jgi:hypothetical protein
LELINTGLDIEAATEAYRRLGRVTIENILTEQSAEVIYKALRQPLPWEYWSRGPEGSRVVAPERYATLSEEQRRALIPPLPAKAGDFHFAYERVTLEGPASRDTPLGVLCAFKRALNSPAYVDLVRRITGAGEGNRIEGQVSRYRPGHYLSPHTDANRDQVRLAAHVIGLTRDWEPHWGGELTFCNNEGDIEAQEAPRFNTLTLFRVPRWHYVAPVKIQAVGDRLSFFGWLVSHNLSGSSREPTTVIR